MAETVSHEPGPQGLHEVLEGCGGNPLRPVPPRTVRYQPSSSGNILPSSPAIPHHIGRVVRKASDESEY